CFFFFQSRRRHTISKRDWSSDVCSSDLLIVVSPNTAFLILPSSVIEKTIKGMSLSIHNEEAVESMTPRPSFNMSMYDRLSYFLRSEERRVGIEYMFVVGQM